MTTKLEMITARRTAEFAAIAPVEFVETPAKFVADPLKVAEIARKRANTNSELAHDPIVDLLANAPKSPIYQQIMGKDAPAPKPMAERSTVVKGVIVEPTRTRPTTPIVNNSKVIKTTVDTLASTAATKINGMVARTAIESATVDTIEFKPTKHIDDLDFTPIVEPTQIRSLVPTVTQAPENVRFNLDVAPFEYREGIAALPGQEQEILEDATEAWWLLPQTSYSPIRVATHKHHVVELTAGDRTFSLPLPALDLDLADSGSAQELAARLRSCYRDTMAEWMVPVVDAKWNIWDRDSETDPDSSPDQHPDKWASKVVEQRHTIARFMEKAHRFFDISTLPILNVWVGMDSAVAATIINAIRAWKNPPVRAARWTGDAQVETFDRLDYQDADLTPEMVISRRYDQELDTIAEKWEVALYDSNRELLYFREHLDSATKDIAIDQAELVDIHIHHISGEFIGGNLIPDYFAIEDVEKVHVMTAQTHTIVDSVDVERPIRKPIGKGKYELVGYVNTSERFVIPMEITPTGKLATYTLMHFADGTTFPTEKQLADLRSALTTWKETKAESEELNASPAHRQTLHDRQPNRHIAHHIEPINADGSIGTERYIARHLDSLSAAEAIALLNDEFDTGRLPEMVTMERIDDYQTVFYITETDTRYYADGTLMDDAAQITSKQLVDEQVYIPEGTLTLRYNAKKDAAAYRIGRATIVNNRMVDRLDKWAIKPEVVLPRVQAGIAAYHAAEAKYVEDARIAALPKASKERKGFAIPVTPYSPLAHIEDGHITIYVGRTWEGHMEGSVLANGPTKHVGKYKTWLNDSYKDKRSQVRAELQRIAQLVRDGESVRIMAWADAPKDADKKAKRTPPAYAAVIVKAVQFLAAKQ